MKNNFISADLHVHTPASKCYKGESTDLEYINILRNYLKKDIRIIAITDHNTIKGYNEITRIKTEIDHKIKILETYKEKIPDLGIELDELKSDKAIFDKLLILPGVELEANPGIHLLLIFNPEQDLIKVENLLENCGFTQSIQGQENPDIEIKVDVLEALKLAKELNALTIAAHVDSHKGIYNDLNGTYRARVFKSDYLDGISVNSTIQIEKIKSLLSQPDYKRNKPLAFIQSSDHHHISQCGSKITYLNVSELSFSSISECFKNPISNISPTAKPEIKNIIHQLANDKNSILIDEINKELILSSACALLNNSFGKILIGITNDRYKNIKGVEIEASTIKTIEETIIKSLKPDKIFYKLSIISYAFGDRSVIVIDLQNISSKCFFFKNKHYHFEDGKVIESNAETLISKTSKKSNNLLEEFYTSYDSRLAIINNELQLLMESKHSLSIINKVSEEGIIISEIMNLELLHYNEKLNLNKELPFGCNGGQVYTTKYTPARADNCYIRCTCPSTNTIEYIEDNSKTGIALVLQPGGGIHIIESEKFNIYNTTTKYPSILLKLNSEFKDINPYIILAWLKSSVLLWYTYSIYGDYDIYTPSIFRDVKIPVSLFHNETANIIDQKIKEIIRLESIFLTEQENYIEKYKEEEIDEVLNKFAEAHNKKVDVIALEIDDVINEKLHLSEEESDILHNFLLLKDLHTLSSEELTTP